MGTNHQLHFPPQNAFVFWVKNSIFFLQKQKKQQKKQTKNNHLCGYYTCTCVITCSWTVGNPLIVLHKVHVAFWIIYAESLENWAFQSASLGSAITWILILPYWALILLPGSSYNWDQARNKRYLLAWLIPVLLWKWCEQNSVIAILFYTKSWSRNTCVLTAWG